MTRRKFDFYFFCRQVFRPDGFYLQLWKTSMRRLFFIILNFFSTLLFGQNSSAFEGTMIFKETHYYQPLTRTTSDTLISYYSYNVYDSLNIELLLRPDFDSTLKYLPVKFNKRNDSLFLGFFDPVSNKQESRYTFPLNKRDTAKGEACYKMRVVTYVDDNKMPKQYLEECPYDDSYEYTITFSGDTVFKLGDRKFHCYVIAMHFKGKSGMDAPDLEIMRTVLIDKKLLFPVEEIEYRYYNWIWFQNLPKNKWILFRHLKLIDVD